MGSVIELLRSFLIYIGFIPRPDLVAKVIGSHPLLESIEPGLIYVVGEKGYIKWAYFRCPADPNEIIQLCLMPNRRPRWIVTIDLLHRPTIDPSVRQLEGSYAHFWIKRGTVEWCEDSGRSSYGQGRDKRVHIEA